MTDLQSTLNAIDAATGCQQCEGPLGDSPSPDWCSQDCQEEYFASRSVALVGYREPYDLPEHIGNQREQCSPETSPAWNWAAEEMVRWGISYFAFDEHRALRPVAPDRLTLSIEPVPDIEFTLAVDSSRFERAMESAWAYLERLAFRANWHPIGLINSLKVATVEPEPPLCATEGVEYDFDYPTTPALTADTPPAPVMAPVELDVEAIQRQVDGFETPQTVRRALRRIDPRRSR